MLSAELRTTDPASPSGPIGAGSGRLVTMGTLARDTDRAAEEVQIRILKALPAWRKLELLDDACETARALALAGLQSRHPEASPSELHRRLMGLLLGEDIAVVVWGSLDEAT